MLKFSGFATFRRGGFRAIDPPQSRYRLKRCGSLIPFGDALLPMPDAALPPLPARYGVLRGRAPQNFADALCWEWLGLAAGRRHLKRRA